MKAGSLRHKAQFQRATEARDTRGGVTLTWTTYAHGWVGYTIDKGSEAMAAMQREATQPIMVQARYISGVKTTDRLKVDGRVLEIMAVSDPDGRRRELSMVCRELVNG